ncbi:MAG: fibrinogen-like YCDxxxxGGGW domain-containing protein [Myxococcota bacterium]|nr:fibrinogen-like YCDxxxxGGGW domain-containing protein [Myxococcota bacterium]
MSDVQKGLFFAVLVGCSEENVGVINSTPTVEIVNQADVSEHAEGESIMLSASLTDNNHSWEHLGVRWFKDGESICDDARVDEESKTECSVPVVLGEQRILVEVYDVKGASGTDAVILVGQPTYAPNIEIESPVASGRYYSDEKVPLTGFVHDAEDTADELSVSWFSDIQGEIQANTVITDDGSFYGAAYLSEGEHYLRAVVEDSTGKTETQSVIVRVGTPNSLPTCGITSPVGENVGAIGLSTDFAGFASDADIPSDWLSITWESDKDGSLGQSTPNSNGEILFSTAALSVNHHIISMIVRDETGASCTDIVPFTVTTPPSVQILSPSSGAILNEGEMLTFDGLVADAEDASDLLSLEWRLSGGEVLYNYNANSDGQSSFSTSNLPFGDYAVELAVTDSAGFTSVVSSVFTINALPTAPSVEINPNEASTTDDLVAVPQGSIDSNGDFISYTYQWMLNGILTNHTTNTILAGETSKNDVWTVVVTPNDGVADGPSTIQSIEVRNTAPEITGISFNTQTVYTNDTLIVNAGATDADGDSVTFQYQWFVNNVSVQSGASNQLNGSEIFGSGTLFDKNQSIYVLVSANDGTDTTGEASSMITVLNTPPNTPTASLPGVAITPGLEDLTCSIVSAEDVDAEELSFLFHWYVDGVEYDGSTTSTVYDGDTIPTEMLGSYEAWSCSVEVVDEDGESNTSAEVTIDLECSMGAGHTSECPATSCLSVLEDGESIGDGVYWVDPMNTGTAFQAYCDMTTDGGGWTMCYTASNEVHIETETEYSVDFGVDGYRTACGDVLFTDTIYHNHDSGEKAWFTSQSGEPLTLNGLGYNSGYHVHQTLFDAHGVASTNWSYEMNVCDDVWMHVGIMMTGYYDGCHKRCGSWCDDVQSPYFRTNGDVGYSYNGVAFNENGHGNVSSKLMSVGIR